MQRFKTSLLAAAGILLLAFVLNAVGPKRVMAALGYTPVRDVDGAGRQPFSAHTILQANGLVFLTGPPAGKRLVITYVSSDALGTGEEGIIVRTNVNTPDQSDIVAPFTHSSAGSWASVAGDSLAHAEPGTTLLVSLVGANIADVSIHGYLVDVP